MKRSDYAEAAAMLRRLLAAVDAGLRSSSKRGARPSCTENLMRWTAVTSRDSSSVCVRQRLKKGASPASNSQHISWPDAILPDQRPMPARTPPTGRLTVTRRERDRNGADHPVAFPVWRAARGRTVGLCTSVTAERSPTGVFGGRSLLALGASRTSRRAAMRAWAAAAAGTCCRGSWT